MVSSPVQMSIPSEVYSFLKIRHPRETATGQVNCLRTPTAAGPDAEVVFAGRWDSKDGVGRRKR